MVLDVYSRKTVGNEVHVAESADLAALLMRKASLAEVLAAQGYPAFGQRQCNERGDDAGHIGETWDHAVVQQAVRGQRQSVRGAAVSHLHELPALTVRDRHSGTAMGAAVRAVVNHQHNHSGLKFVTPAQRHAGHADAVLRRREQVYEAARQRCPERWSGATRNCQLKKEVWLNLNELTKNY